MNQPESQAIGRGSIVVGDVIGSYNAIGHGAQVMVTVLPPEQRPSIEPWPTPIPLGPHPFPGLLGREEEIRGAFAALQAGKPVEVYGEPGVGKTAFLRHLAYHPDVEMFPDGVVYLPARRKPLEDVLQFIYEAFYESQPATKATAVQLRHLLPGKQALILLDDVILDRSEVASLLEDIKGCAVVLAASDRHLLGEGRSLALKGLSTEDALAMVEREVGDIPAAEQSAFQSLCSLFDGHPLRILQAVTNARDEGLTLTDLVGQVDTATPDESLVVQLLGSLSPEERRVVAILAVFGDVPLPVEHLAALTNIADIETVLEGLVDRNIVQTHSPSYSLTGSLAKSWADLPELDALRENALTYFVNWAEQNQQALRTLADNGDAIRHIMDWATKAGRWETMLRLAQAMDASFMLNGHWGAWHDVLQSAQRAAYELGNTAARAWALHQFGTRALCLGDTAAARVDLSDALHLLEALGDSEATAVTRQNLSLLAPTPVPQPVPPAPVDHPTKAPPQKFGTAFGPLGAVVLVILLTAGVVLSMLPNSPVSHLVRSPPGSAAEPSPTFTKSPSPPQTSTWTPTTPPTSPPRCIVIVEALNLRSGPGTNYPSIKTLFKGTELLPRRYSDGWMEGEVVGSNEVGWVSTNPEFVSCSGGESISTPTYTPSPTSASTQHPTDAVTPIPTLNIASAPPTLPQLILSLLTRRSKVGKWVGDTEQDEPIFFMVDKYGPGEAVHSFSFSYVFPAPCPIGKVSFSSLDNGFISEGPSSSFRMLSLKTSDASASVEGGFTSNSVVRGTITIKIPPSRSCDLITTITWDAKKQ